MYTNIKLVSATPLHLKLCKCSAVSYLYCLKSIEFCSPGVLPIGQNNPQKNKYELYNEGVCISTLKSYRKPTLLPLRDT
jgi:hypothetical protein